MIYLVSSPTYAILNLLTFWTPGISATFDLKNIASKRRVNQHHVTLGRMVLLCRYCLGRQSNSTLDHLQSSVTRLNLSASCGGRFLD